MIIIEGKSGKSKILEEIINNRLMNRNVAILDSVVVASIYIPEGVDHFICKDCTVEEVIEMYQNYNFDKYEWIIFEVNMNKSKFDINCFKQLDRDSTQNFIVTVQTNENVKMKFA
jgi:hypothetical protein